MRSACPRSDTELGTCPRSRVCGACTLLAGRSSRTTSMDRMSRQRRRCRCHTFLRSPRRGSRATCCNPEDSNRRSSCRYTEAVWSSSAHCTSPASPCTSSRPSTAQLGTRSDTMPEGRTSRPRLDRRLRPRIPRSPGRFAPCTRLGNTDLWRQWSRFSARAGKRRCTSQRCPSADHRCNRSGHRTPDTIPADRTFRPARDARCRNRYSRYRSARCTPLGSSRRSPCRCTPPQRTRRHRGRLPRHRPDLQDQPDRTSRDASPARSPCRSPH
jgi:hypothetical protein